MKRRGQKKHVMSYVTSEDVYRAYLNPTELVSGGTVSLNWTEDAAVVYFNEGEPENIKVMRVDLNTGDLTPLCDVEAVRAALAATVEGGVMRAYAETQWVTARSTGRTSRADDDAFGEMLGSASKVEPALRMWKRTDYLSSALDVPEQRSPDREWLASIHDSNIVLRSVKDQKYQDRQLTRNGTKESYWDIEAPRVRMSSGRRIHFGGTTPWSPDSLTLLAYRRKTVGVPCIPRVNWLKPLIDVEYFHWQMVGSTIDRIEPVFVNVRSGQQTEVLLTDVEDRYIQLLGWHPDACEALMIVYTRDFKRADIIASNRETGSVRTLLTESAFTFVKIQTAAIFAGEHGVWILPDGTGFLWLSSRDGWNHLYHYDMKGQLIRKLTSGDWPVHEVKYIAKDGFIYITASPDKTRPYDVHVCRIPLRGGDLDQLTTETGIHVPSFSPGGHAFLDTHSGVDRPTRADLVRPDGARIRVLSEMNIARLKTVGYTPAEEFTVKAIDGETDLWGVLYKPFNFDASQSYAVIEYIYAGPQAIETPRFFAIDRTMMSSMNMLWALSQLGYIVVCLDARGTPGRSKQFQDAVYGDWTVGMPDHASAIHQLCERHGWMDGNRVGIMGHSWGGYFSTCALMREPDTYHAAVAYAPHYDPWDGLLYEPYLNLPTRDRTPYENADLFKQAHKIKGRLMIVAGTSDNGFSTTMKMTRALIDAGVDHEFVVVPQALHHFKGAELNYLLMKLRGWFDHHVKNRVVNQMYRI